MTKPRQTVGQRKKLSSLRKRSAKSINKEKEEAWQNGFWNGVEAERALSGPPPVAADSPPDSAERSGATSKSFLSRFISYVTLIFARARGAL